MHIYLLIWIILSISLFMKINKLYMYIYTNYRFLHLDDILGTKLLIESILNTHSICFFFYLLIELIYIFLISILYFNHLYIFNIITFKIVNMVYYLDIAV